MSVPMYALAAFLLAGAALPAAAEEADMAAALAGRWSVQSTVTKLVRVPVLESRSAMTVTRPAWAMGSAGSDGSRVVHTMKDKEVPMSVTQETTLGFRPDGRFMMISSQDRAASPTNRECRITTLEEKIGRYRVSGGTLVLTVEAAIEHREDSCDAGKSSATPMSGGTETYTFVLSGGTLRLEGPGGAIVLNKA